MNNKLERCPICGSEAMVIYPEFEYCYCTVCSSLICTSFEEEIVVRNWNEECMTDVKSHLVNKAVTTEPINHEEFISFLNTDDTKEQNCWIQWGRDSAYNKYYRCSNCKHEIIVYSDDMYGGIELPNTCEHCGTKMFTMEEEE